MALYTLTYSHDDNGQKVEQFKGHQIPFTVLLKKARELFGLKGVKFRKVGTVDNTTIYKTSYSQLSITKKVGL